MDENPVQGLGFISRLKNRLSQVDQRTAFDAFIVVLILIGLAASVYLAGQQQIFRSRAAQNGSAEVVDEQGNAMPKEGENFIVETPQIRIKIEFPTDWNTQGFVPNLAKSVYGQEEDQGFPQCLDQGTWRGDTCINANYYKSDGTFVRDGNEPGCYPCTQNDTSSQPTQPIPEELQQPIPTQIPTRFPTPTKIQESEQIQWVRISLNKQNVESGNCANILLPEKQGLGNADQKQHCMEFSLTDPYFLQNGGIVDWWLPPEPETYAIYVGFVSNKGNYMPGPQITVTYKPKSGTISGTVTVIANNRPYQRVFVRLAELTDDNQPGELVARTDLLSLYDSYIYDDADYSFTFNDLDKKEYAIIAFVGTQPQVNGGGNTIFTSGGMEVINVNSVNNLTVKLPPVYASRTPETEDIILLGRLVLQGVVDMPLHPDKPLKISVYDSNSELLIEKEGNIEYKSSDGEFEIGDRRNLYKSLKIDHPLGRVTIKAKVPRYLIKILYNGIIENETNNIYIPQQTLIAGDINGDNVINYTDYDIAVACYGDKYDSCLNSSKTPTSPDVNDDGKVDQVDLNLLLFNFGQRGD